jgi:hypothetical protein
MEVRSDSDCAGGQTRSVCFGGIFLEVDEQRPLVQLAIIAGISAGVRAVAISISPIAGSVQAAVALLLLPADDREPRLLVCRFTGAHRGGHLASTIC